MHIILLSITVIQNLLILFLCQTNFFKIGKFYLFMMYKPKLPVISSVARGVGEAIAPHWPEKYEKYHVLNAFEADFCSKTKNSSPQWDWRADVVKNLLLFEPEKWSFLLLEIT